MRAAARASHGDWRFAAAAGAVLAAFALLFTAGSALGAWPPLPQGAFQGWDLWTGLGVGAGLVMSLLRSRSALE